MLRHLCMANDVQDFAGNRLSPETGIALRMSKSPNEGLEPSYSLEAAYQ